MNENSRYAKNVLYAALIGGVFLTSLYYFLNIGTNSASAATPKVNMSISPTSKSYPIIQTNYSTVVLQTGSSSQKISGYSLVFQSTGPIVFSDVSAPVAIGGANLQVTQVRKQVTPQRIQIDYTIFGSDTSLPQAISMKVYYSGAFNGSGKISLNSASSQVVGNIPGHSYIWGKLGTGSYSFSGPYPTTIPTRAVTPGVVNCSTQCDATGDRCYNDQDYPNFDGCYRSPSSQPYCYTRWDSNADNIISLVDYQTCSKTCACK